MKTALLKRGDAKLMAVRFKTAHESRTSFHFERSRLNNLFMEAVKYLLVLVYRRRRLENGRQSDFV